MPVTADFQVEYASLLLGPGTDYEILKIEGLDMPAVRTNDLLKDTTDGAFGGKDILGIRVVTITLEVNGTPGPDLAQKLRTLATAWNRKQTDSALTYRLESGGVRHVNGRPRRCAWAVEKWAFDVGIVPTILQLECTDPNIYNTSNAVVLV